jgi:PII-like signaling protein
MTGPAKMLLILIDENDMKGDLHLYEVILRRLKRCQVSGATVQSGIMGFGAHGSVHRKRLFGVSDDRPITIMTVDREEIIRKAAEEIRPLVSEGLILLTDVEVLGPY